MESYPLYGGEVTLNFDPVKHRYSVGEEQIDGVTTVLSVINKPALIAWSAGCAADHVLATLRPGQVMNEMTIKALANECRSAHRKKKESAADVGTFIHEWVEHFIKTGEEKDIEHPEIKAGVGAFKDWLAKHPDVEFLGSEEKIYSKKYGFAGTTDIRLRTGGKLYIGDLKTGKAIYPEYFLQTSAYQIGRQEEYPDEDYEGQIIINCQKDGGLVVATSERGDFEKNRDAFLAALSLYRWQKSIPKD